MQPPKLVTLFDVNDNNVTSMKEPLVSIVIPCYNSEKFISATIDSFLNQTFKNIEIIIQDDCSTDNTWTILQSYKSKNGIKLYRNQTNLGIGENWNRGYSKISGEFVVIANSDDIVFPEFLEKTLQKFQVYPAISFVCTTAMRRDESLTIDLWDIQSFKNTGGIFIDFTKKKVSKNRLLAWQFTLAKVTALELLKEDGMLFYPTQCCDGELWLRVHQKKMSAYYIEEVLGYYRTHSQNNSSILFGEFESTFKDLAPRHPWCFETKFYVDTLPKVKTILYYIFIKIKTDKKINWLVLSNFLKYNFSI